MRWPLHRCLTALEGDHLVLVPVPVRWGTSGITPRKGGLEPVGWVPGRWIELGGGRMAGGCGRVAGGGGTNGYEDVLGF